MITYETLHNLIDQSVDQWGVEKTAFLLQDLLATENISPPAPLLDNQSELAAFAFYLGQICGQMLDISFEELYDSRYKDHVKIKKLYLLLLHSYTQASYADLGKYLNHSPRHVRKVVRDCKAALQQAIPDPVLINKFHLLKRHAVAYIAGLKLNSHKIIEP